MLGDRLADKQTKNHDELRNELAINDTNRFSVYHKRASSKTLLKSTKISSRFCGFLFSRISSEILLPREFLI